MKTSVFTALLFLFSSPLFACIEFLSSDYKFINEDSKTAAVNYHGVIRNNCGRVIKFPVIHIITLDEDDVPRHVFKHLIAYELDHGELQEYDYTSPLKYNVLSVKTEITWENS